MSSTVRTITKILLAGRPTFCDGDTTGHDLKVKIQDFKSALSQLRAGALSRVDALVYADTCQRLHRPFMVKFRKEDNQPFAQCICKDLFDKSGKLHAYIKNNWTPKCMFSKGIGTNGGVTTDPSELLKLILKELEAIWGCDDPSKVDQAAKVIRTARDEAIMSANSSPPMHGSDMKRSAGHF